MADCLCTFELQYSTRYRPQDPPCVRSIRDGDLHLEWDIVYPLMQGVDPGNRLGTRLHVNRGYEC